jgi:hypothetical protein
MVSSSFLFISFHGHTTLRYPHTSLGILRYPLESCNVKSFFLLALFLRIGSGADVKAARSENWSGSGILRSGPIPSSVPILRQPAEFERHLLIARSSA